MTEAAFFTREDAIAIISIDDVPDNRMSLEFMDQLEVLVDIIASGVCRQVRTGLHANSSSSAPMGWGKCFANSSV